MNGTQVRDAHRHNWTRYVLASDTVSNHAQDRWQPLGMADVSGGRMCRRDCKTAAGVSNYEQDSGKLEL